jgi:flavodoxin
MKTIIICESVSHGNTLSVANAMAGVFDAKVVKPGDFDPATVNDYDLIGLGSGIYHGKHHKNILELVDEMPSLNDRSIFIFSTSGKGDISQHKHLVARLAQKGYSNAGEFTCKGWDTSGLFKFIGGINKGLPNKAMLKQARDFAKSILDAAITE